MLTMQSRPARAAVLVWWADRYGLLRRLSPARRVAAAGRAVALLRGLPDPPATPLARALTVHSRRLWEADRTDEALLVAEQACGVEAAGWVGADAWYARAQVLRALGRYDEALDAATTAVARCRGLAASRRLAGVLGGALYTQALILDALKRWDEALPPGEEAVRLMAAVPFWKSRWVLRTLWKAQCELVQLLWRTGRFADALPVGDAALEWTGTLGRFYPAYVGPFRAEVQTYLGLCHAGLGQLEQATVLVGRSVDGFRSLGDRWRGNLAWALEYSAERLAAVGRHADADAAVREAGELYGALADAGQGVYRPYQLLALRRRRDLLWAAGEREAAVDVVDAALPVLRRHAADDSGTFAADLAETLSVQADQAATVGREEALTYADEAVAMARRLGSVDGPAEGDDAASRETLAVCLHNRAIMLQRLGRAADAVPSAAEAVTLRQAQQDAGRAYRRIDSVGLLAELLYRCDRHEEAAEKWSEAVALLRGQADDPARHRLLATDLHNLGAALGSAHRHEAAITALDESIGYRRALADREPDEHLPTLARALRVRSHDHSAIRQFEQARRDIEESITIYERLAATDPGRFAKEVAGSKRQALQQQRLAG